MASIATWADGKLIRAEEIIKNQARIMIAGKLSNGFWYSVRHELCRDRFLWIPLEGEVGCLIGSQGLHSSK